MPPGISPIIGHPMPANAFRSGATINQHPQMYSKAQRESESEDTAVPPKNNGPVITVFVGNISEKVSEKMIKKIVATVGRVINWKRVSTFGFCEYEYVIGNAILMFWQLCLADVDCFGFALITVVPLPVCVRCDSCMILRWPARNWSPKLMRKTNYCVIIIARKKHKPTKTMKRVRMTQLWPLSQKSLANIKRRSTISMSYKQVGQR